MHSARTTSVLGKRSQRQDQSSACEQLQTPQPTPDFKRVRTLSTSLDGDGNKENLPPFALNALNDEIPSPITDARAARALRRSATGSMQSTPARPELQIGRSATIPTPATPATAISTLHISTPPPTPLALLPLETRTRALLRATCDDTDDLPGREEERQAIAEFVQNFLGDDEQGPQSLYISGSPGSGKTALVASVLHSLAEELANVKLITINCMALDDADALWRIMLVELDTSKKPKTAVRCRKHYKGKETAEAVVAAMKTKCIMILDELDHIAPTTQTFASLLSLSETSSNLLRVIGIANTHTLSTTSIFNDRVRTLHFAPYSSAQLLRILQSRLATLHESDKSSAAVKKFLPIPTLILLTKKVASLTGDVRYLFEILREAIDSAMTACTSTVVNVLEASPCSVTPADVLLALRAHNSSSAGTPSSSPGSSPVVSNSEIVSKISSLGLQARLVLLSILLASKRLEAGLALSGSILPSTSAKKCSPSKSFLGKDIGIDTQQLHGYYSNMLSRGDSDLCVPASRNEFIDLTAMLEGMGLVNISAVTRSTPTKVAKRRFGRSSSFGSTISKAAASGDVRLGAGIWVDEVLRGLGINKNDYNDAKEEEARVIWNRECSRLAKEVKILQAKSIKPQQPGAEFPDAFED
ncbi:P-loop containing nucleoside triphosphate hydrolase protein [Lentinula aciculospora]|uniref:P-loop containing nucleoside triphosphate hydrolase protein n=1 Tax=Lentinula aciculospora TaxID=153920 RepID=A0A9W9DSS9_9AGAR|nr:P-loop containing nucleoside triphosphate hydrolase protein [Lentinula aciculospora]